MKAMKVRMHPRWTWARRWQIVREVSTQAIILSIPFWMLGFIALIAAWLSGRWP